MTCLSQLLVDRHFAGALTPREEHWMREHIALCEACRARYRRQLLLAKLDPSAERPEKRLERGLFDRRVRPVLPLVVSALAIAAALLLFLRPSDGFAPRGLPLSSTIAVYRVANGDGITPAMESVTREDELAFSYVNGAGKTHLMIFGVDENSRIYWFYPAWTSELENPRAVPIEATDRRPHELREAIRHRFAGAKLEVHGLFLDSPMTVREVEAIAQKHETAAIPDGIDHVITLEMKP
jgi:hypothetical protein